MDCTKEQESFAALCKAMGHPSRVVILEYLASISGCYFGEVCENVALSKATISQHLSILKEVGLIDEKPEGVKVFYSVNRTNWRNAKSTFADFFSNVYRERGVI